MFVQPEDMPLKTTEISGFIMHMDLEQGITIILPSEPEYVSFTAITFGISSFGMFLSFLALLFLITTACLFKDWRNNHKNQLLIQFMIARFMYTFIRFMFDVRLLWFNKCDGKVCVLYMDEILMIYTEMALVSWMFTFSRQMYDSLVVVLNTRTRSVWKVSLISWFLPAVVTILLYSTYECFDNGIVIYFFYLAIAKWPALIVNAVILIMILKSLTKPNNTANLSSQANNKKLVVVMNIMIWSFCIQQAFVDIYMMVYVTMNLPSFFFIFINICAMYHCAIALTFWVLGNAKTRNMWRKKLGCAVKSPLSPQTSLQSTK